MNDAGILSEAEYIGIYCKARNMPLPDAATYDFCLALSIFRMAAILAGVGARALLGNAASRNAQQVNYHKCCSMTMLHFNSSDGALAMLQLILLQER